jgi:phosphate-selective porin OprO/OprP
LLYYDDLAEGRYLMHVGGGFNYSQIGGHGTTGPDAQGYQARTIPGVFVGDPAGGGVTAAGTPFTLDTGRFRATDFSVYHLEWAGNYGSAHFQTEYVATVVNQANGGPPVFLDGVYAQTGYFLTGESVGYNKQMGAMDYNVKPNSRFFGLGRNSSMCGWGAWELAARYDFLDLRATKVLPSNIIPNPTPVAPSPGAGLATQIPGTGAPNPGYLNMGTFALNWWWNEYTRLQFEYIYASNQSNLYGHNAMSIGAARFQVEF